MESEPLRIWLSDIFGLSKPVPRALYATVGFVLIGFKYGVEAGIQALGANRFFSPFDFINPTLAAREQYAADAPNWLTTVWIFWTLPFLWIALSMSVRRAAYLGQSPWWGLIVVVPIVNIPAMLYWSLASDKIQPAAADSIPASAMEPMETTATPTSAPYATLAGLAGGVVYMIAMALGSVYLADSYGHALFFGTPLITGALMTFVLNRPIARPFWESLAYAALAVTVGCFAFLFIGFEGFICIAMAIPIMVPLGILGGVLGYGIATGLCGRDEKKGMLHSLLLLPVLAGIEPYFQTVPEFEVMSSVDIDAPPSHVWQNVVRFTDIKAQPAWFFRLGIATPMRARIEGTGVGAIRYCEFTTGTFVEPITVWDEPRQLAFDVAEQPEPMLELTPYGHLHPPHLRSSFRSQRGEFRLVPLPDGGTRLEGRTWYQLRIYPIAYWNVWADGLVHRIHDRVLQHIKSQTESIPRTITN
ncbi:MAG: SRPBCC family protein [Planctomycetota bacterium]|nr:SRPBCC family protein [Planctomycetota bacterium]